MVHGLGLGRRGKKLARGSGTGEGDPEPLRITDRRMLGWFAQHLGPHWPSILVATIAMIVSSVAQVYVPVVVGQRIVQEAIIQGHSERLATYIGWMAGLVLLVNFFSAVRMNIMHRLGQLFVYDLRMIAYEHLQKLSLSYFHQHNTGDIMSRISNDVGSVEDMVVHGTDTVISSTAMLVFIIVILFRTNVLLATVALVPVPIFVGLVIVFARIIRPLYEKIREQLGEINTTLQENISGIQVVKAFGREDHELEEFRRTSQEYLRLNIRGIWLWTSFFPFLSFLTSMGMVVVIWIAGTMTKTQHATVGDLLVFVGELQQFYQPVGSLLRVHNVFNRALAALARIFQLLDEEPDVKEAPDAIELEEVKGRVVIDHVSFRYKTGELVLKDVTVIAEPGETVAVVGRSGAGKTSLVNLIPRFYDPQEGRVLVDDIDVRQVTLRSLRSHMAMVLQETFLFDGTVKDNIRYGRLDATDEEIVEAAKAAYAHEFIQQLPDGYDTIVGERGVKLSGGQRQRIAIARALLRNPRILILDEATSLVDTEAEQMIQAALENLMQGRTTFVIAHRLSTVRNADKIVVIDGGEVVEQADHKTLMERGGLYADMYMRQFQLQEYGLGHGLGEGPPT
ncbi:MAG: ABC transporter ATP-binding protein [Armatimonadetes bacterium]|nr:ABC transporter ATP-binding protein [Armatimonadota bacterium]